MTASTSTYACRGCGELGHNIRRCPNPGTAPPRKRKRTRTTQNRTTAAVQRRRKKVRAAFARYMQRGKVSPTTLRAEGVLAVGCAVGQVLFVLTYQRLHIIHAHGLPERFADPGAQHVVRQLEDGRARGAQA